jgi:hypothetical protein
LFRFSGAFLLRFSGRQFLGLLFQLPPRITRDEIRRNAPADGRVDGISRLSDNAIISTPT